MTMAQLDSEPNYCEPADTLTEPSTLENFLSVLVHDIKAPIRHMRMHLEDISDAAGADQENPNDTYNQDDLKSALNNADKSMHRLKRIADKLGEYHISLLQPQPDLVPLGELCQKEQSKLEHLITQTGATVTIDTLPSIMGDREQLGLILNNLLENALLYHGDTPPHIRISAEKTNGHQRLIIQDNGQGIPENQLPQVTKPFVRLHAKDSIEGAGLGLWIAKTLAEKHYMKLFLENNPNTTTQSETPDSNVDEAAATNDPNRGCRAILQWAT